MCLTTRFPFIKTKKPIFCYKAVRKGYTSQYQKFPYELNKLYVLDYNLIAEIGHMDVMDIIPECLCRQGDYYGRKGIESAINNFKYLKVINHGFHAYRNLKNAIKIVESFPKELIVVKCVIPEGSTIGINYNEIVSNQIAIIEQVKYDNSN